MLGGRIAHLRRHGGPVERSALGRIDAVLVSHAHLDHLDVASLRRVAGPDVALVAPADVAAIAGRLGFGAVHAVAAGDLAPVGPVKVAAVRAEHRGRRHPLHRGEGTALGFVVAGSRRVYFAGDTGLFDAMADIADPRLDAALLPVWGWGPALGPGHLDPDQAATALTLLRPRVAVPIHWGTLFPYTLGRRHGHLLTDPPRRFARAAAEVAPDVDVRVLDPGASTRLPER